MKSFKFLFGIGALALGAQSAMAESPVYEPPQPITSTVSREDVTRATLAATQAGTIVKGEANFELPKTVTDSGQTRAQVLAEAIEARRLGLIAQGELPLREATQVELEQIRQAGLRARHLHVAG